MGGLSAAPCRDDGTSDRPRVMKIELIVVGRLKKGPLHEVYQEYAKRLKWPLSVIELESRLTDEKQAQTDEIRQILTHIKQGAVVIALDERGKSLPSRQFAKKIEQYQSSGTPLLQCLIGGANGLGV